MALEVSMTGTGTIGDITPNWTVNEFATPVAIGSTASGTGSVSFNAKANDDSLLCINNDVVSTVNGFGTVSGVIQSVTQSGINVSLTHGSLLDKLNLDVSMPALLSGDTASALDYFEQDVLGVARTTKTFGQFFTMAGHGYCFVNDGNGKAVFQDASVIQRRPVFGIEDGAFTGYSYTDIRNTVSVTNFVRSNQQIYGNDVNGYMFSSDGGFGAETNVSRIFYKTFLNGANNVLSFTGVPALTSFEWDLEFALTVNHSAETITMAGNYSPGGSFTAFSSSASIASLDIDTELAVFLEYYVEVGNVYKLRALICNVSDYSTYVTVTQDLSFGSTPIIDAWSIDGLARDIYVETNTPTYTAVTPAEWGVASTLYSDSSTRTFGAPSVAYTGVFWEYLQMACAALGQEVAVIDNVINVRDVGSLTFDITNVVASPTISPTSTLSGKQINIPYTDSAYVSGTVYSAAADGNNIISVNAGETTVTSVKHTVNPIYVTQPTRSDTWPVESGQYYVSDSSGVRLLAGEWEEYGASVTVNIDPDDASAIQITVVGPYTDTTLAGGPYELVASDGSNKYASLEIAGTGVYSGTGVLGLLTGLDPDKYTRATVNTITNPFIADVEHAYDRGVWAAQKASGPTIALSAQVPASSIDGIGLTCGSLVDYRDSTYRITACSISGIGASIIAERHVTVADVDAIWAAGKVSKAVTVALGTPATFTSASHGFVDGDPITITSVGLIPTVEYSIAIDNAMTVPGTNNFRYYYTNFAPVVYDNVTITGYTVSAYNVTNKRVLVSTPEYFEVAGDGGTYSADAGPGNVTWNGELYGGYVVNAATNTFQLAAYPGGSALKMFGFSSGTYTATTSTYSATEYDSFWGNYECQDQIIFPYKVA